MGGLLSLAVALALATLALPAAALPDTFSALRADAEAGNVEAQAAVGRTYASGWYKDEQVNKDLSQARLWLSKAADAGSGEAAFEMGRTFYPDDGVEGVPWYRKAALAGISAAYPRLCMAYRAKALNDWDEALIWCRKAAEAGDTAPYLALARALQTSDPRAIAIYAQLADWGDLEAARVVADHHLRGQGLHTDTDDAQALRYTRLAIGLAPEIYIADLARLHAVGIGTATDLVEAARLYQYALRFETPQAPQEEARNWLKYHPEVTRAEVDARLLREHEVADPRKLKHGFARRIVENYKTIGDFYPEKARRKAISGVVVLECLVTDTGDLANCMVASETPKDIGFARQTLLIVNRFGLKSAMPESFKPIAGKLVLIPFEWRLE